MPIDVPQIQSFKPETLTVNPAIRARRGEPKKENVEKLATNMFERRTAGQFHQIQPGVVRVLDDGTIEIIAGDHRCKAEISLNKKVAAQYDKGATIPDEELYQFIAVAVPANDQQALLDALDENEFRQASTVFDRGEAWQRLVDLGFTQEQIATRYAVAPSTVSDTIRCSKLPKKIMTAVEKGQLTEEGAMALARYNKDAALQEELFEIANQERLARETAYARAQARSTGAKEPDKAEVELPQEPESTPAPKSSSKGGAPVSEAVRNKPSPRKTTAPGRTTGEDVKKAIAKKGVQKRKNVTAGKSLKDLISVLHTKYGEREDTPEPYLFLAEAIEEFRDGKLGDQAFINRWEKALRTKFAPESKAAA